MNAVVYEFRCVVRGGPPAVTVKASKEWVERFVTERELIDVFGGCVCWRAPDPPTESMPGEALGIWRRRKVQRLKRLLEARGAEFDVVREEGPRQDLKWCTYTC